MWGRMCHRAQHLARVRHQSRLMPFQILSLSGGGFLGLYTITVLADLEERIGAPIASKFDLIAGTSVGGIIAIGLANEVPAATIKAAFEVQGPSIFSDRPPPKTAVGKAWDVMRSALTPKYKSSALRRTIVQIIGAETLIGDLKHNLQRLPVTSWLH
jgi:patatin-like phospholipase/acyl hydrolase